MNDHAPTELPPCHGLLLARRLDRHAELEPAEVERELADGLPAGKLWLHFDLVDVRAHHFLHAMPGLPAAARAALKDRNEVAHLETMGEAIWGSMLDFHHEVTDAPDATEMGMLEFALTPSLLVTARRHPLRAPGMALRTAGPATPAAQWDLILRNMLDGVTRAATGLGRRLDAIEDRLLQSQEVARTELAAIRREVVLLHRRIEPSAQLYAELAEAPPGWLEAAGHDVSRAAARFEAALRHIASLQERGRIAQDELAAWTAEQTNQRLMVLSVLTAILLPPTLVTGFFGMNTTDLPGTADPGGSAWAIAAILAAAGLALLLLLRMGMLRRRR